MGLREDVIAEGSKEIVYFCAVRLGFVVSTIAVALSVSPQSLRYCTLMCCSNEFTLFAIHKGAQRSGITAFISYVFPSKFNISIKNKSRNLGRPVTSTTLDMQSVIDDESFAPILVGIMYVQRLHDVACYNTRQAPCTYIPRKRY